MAIRFGSTERRNMWTALAFSTAVDFLVVCAVVRLVNGPYEWLWISAALLIAMYVAQMLYGLLGFGKRLLWFWLSEKRARIDALKVEMRSRALPVPDNYFNDAEQYLVAGIEDVDAPNGARLWCSMMVGVLAAQRALSRTDVMLTLICIEGALVEYARENPRRL